MEFMEGGTLSEAVNLCKFEENQIAYVAKELLKGIEFLHSKDFVHRDLKSANVMMSITGEIKIIDFGLCIDLKSGPSRHMLGSPFWIPPEMIRREYHGTPCDIWSFAICMLEMANSKPPHRKSSIRAMFAAVVEDPPTVDNTSQWSTALQEFLQCCLKKNPAERWTASALLKHPFLEKAATKTSMKSILHQIFIEKSLEKSLGI